MAIGRAIVRSPRLFLFDEPLSNLDAQLRGEMRLELAALHRKLGTTMLYVTHDQTEALTLGQVIAVLHQGRVQQVGGPREIYQRPVNRFVAGFLGFPPMNFFEGSVQDGSFVCPAPAFSLPVAGVTPGPAVLGLRPEELTPGEGPLRGRLELVERVGGQSVLHLGPGRPASPPPPRRTSAPRRARSYPWTRQRPGPIFSARIKESTKPCNPPRAPGWPPGPAG